MRHHGPLRVALLMGQDLGYCRQVLSGILTYAEEQKLKWIYHDSPPDAKVLPLLKEWKPHGIIVQLADKTLARRLLKLRVPIVSTTHTLDGFSIPTVDVDHEKVGIEAAHYFLSLGYRSFAYYGSDTAVFSIKRKLGFVKTVETAGFKVSCYHANFLPRSPLTEDWSRLIKAATVWIRSLPKPVAILASNDIPARTLCHICRLTEIRVPQEVAILGVDNDDSECRMSFPTLSSIETPSSKIGQNAARILGALMKNPAQKPANIYLPPTMVIVRESTDTQATIEESIRTALRYMEDHPEDDLDVLKICRVMKMSRRSAERLFREKLRSSIHEQIQSVRIQLAKKLLLETQLSISEIAARSGFGNPRKFNRVFLSIEKRNPSSFRQSSVR